MMKHFWTPAPPRFYLYPRLLVLAAIVMGLTAAGSFIVWVAPPAEAQTQPARQFEPFAPPPEAPLPQTGITAQDVVTPWDIMLVFDISGSMEYETGCYDCWVRTTYDVTQFPFPQNGYYNPLPYWAEYAQPGDAHSIPDSTLCTVYPPVPHQEDGFQYLVHEAELYARNHGDWNFDARQPGQGFWVLQRGSRNGSNAVLEVDGTTTNNEANSQGNRAGNMAYQSSNVCNPAAGGIDCFVGDGEADNVCRDDAGDDVVVDCSAYIKAHPFPTYSQSFIEQARLQGAAYNAECFTGGALSGACWNSHPAGPGPSDVPYVEYDFTPTWDGPTYIWIRARGSGDRAYSWAGNPPTALNAWDRAVYWQVDTGTIQQNTGAAASLNDWRDNRAQFGEWQWYRLGWAATISSTQHTFRLFQGSASYRIDKIVFTNDNSYTVAPNAVRRDYNGAIDVGPPASNGSATREACNLCNPAFGRQVDPHECSCLQNGGEYGTAGTGPGCTRLLTPTNQLDNDLYGGLQPIRGAQEAVKYFARQLNPQCHQVGFVAFTNDAYSDGRSRAKLQCLRWSAEHDAANGVLGCYDAAVTGGNPLSYTRIIEAAERQWPNNSTDIAEGMREGLEELGIAPYANSSDCTTTTNDAAACDRNGAAQRMIILLTDGTPNVNPGNCAPGDGRPDLWDGLIGPNDDNFECAMYFAWQAANNNVVLHTIGLGVAADYDLMTAMATGVDPRGGVVGDGNDVVYFNGAGGQYYSAQHLSDLEMIFDTILANQIPDTCPATLLALDKSVDPQQVAPGRAITYTITVSNTGGISLRNVVITDPLGSHFNFISASHSGTLAAGVVSWTVDAITYAQTITRTVWVTLSNQVSGGAVITNAAWVQAPGSLAVGNDVAVTVPYQIYLPVLLKE